LYYIEGSALWQEIKDLFSLYKSNDAATVALLGPLFNKTKSNAPPVTSSETTSSPNGQTPSPANGENSSTVDDETAAPAGAGTAAPANDGTAAPANDGTAAPANDGTAISGTETSNRRKKRKPRTSNTGKKCSKAVSFIHFQQTLIREKLNTMSKEEAEAVDNHIKTTYAAALELWKRPWLSSSNSDKPETELEMEYYLK
jgi:hypothetical protein